MQLRPPPRPLAPAADVPTALRRATEQLGARPAVTVCHPDARYEQGVASLAQWAAKGAHLLQADLLLAPGDRVHLDAPASWTTAAVALAVWWVGGAITFDGDAEVAVVHPDRDPPDGALEVLHVGDTLDGAPPEPRGAEAWTHAAQPLPDHPPPPLGTAAGVAIVSGGRHLDQATILRMAGAQGEGTAGIEAGQGDRIDELVAIALRPLVVGRATVVLRGVGRDEVAGERITTWC